MGRFTSGGGAVPRKQTLRLTTSNPSVLIPSWARVAYITGTAPGGGGSNSTTAGQRGGGGGAGGYANRVPLQITNETSLAVTIGAAGPGAAAGSNGAGANGGDTTVVMGANTLTLEGGRGALAGPSNGGAGGRAVVGSLFGNARSQNQDPIGGGSSAPFGLAGVASPLSAGATGASSSGSPNGGNGMGAFSPFGSPGPGVDTVTNNTAGGNAAGFGAGGAGGQGTGKGGDGAPSFILIEFEEATTA